MFLKKPVTVLKMLVIHEMSGVKAPVFLISFFGVSAITGSLGVVVGVVVVGVERAVVVVVVVRTVVFLVVVLDAY